MRTLCGKIANAGFHKKMKRGRDSLNIAEKWRRYGEKVPLEHKRLFRRLKRTMWQNRSFVGLVTQEDIERQQNVLRLSTKPKQHFLYMAINFPGRIAACVTYHCGSGHAHSTRLWSDSMDDLQNLIEGKDYVYVPTGPSTPLDRGDTIFFDSMCKEAAKAAIVAWCLCAKRRGVVRDVAQYIARMLWEDKKCWIP